MGLGLLLLIAARSATPSSGSGGGGSGGGGSCATVLPQTLLGGSNLDASYDDASLNATRCCRACDMLAACVGWTLNKKQSRCFLKSLAGAPKHSANAVASGLKPPVPVPTPAPPPPAPLGAKNVLCVPMDDQRPTSRASYPGLSYMHTPAMDRLAAEGTEHSAAMLPQILPPKMLPQRCRKC